MVSLDYFLTGFSAFIPFISSVGLAPDLLFQYLYYYINGIVVPERVSQSTAVHF